MGQKNIENGFENNLLFFKQVSGPFLILDMVPSYILAMWLRPVEHVACVRPPLLFHCSLHNLFSIPGHIQRAAVAAASSPPLLLLVLPLADRRVVVAIAIERTSAKRYTLECKLYCKRDEYTRDVTPLHF
jgi:hypothetical protein